MKRNLKLHQLADIPYGSQPNHLQHYGEAAGAHPNGTRVKKIGSNPKDANQDGALGTVEGSMGPLPDGEYKGMYGYFVRWDSRKDVQVFISGNRVEVVIQ